LGPPQIGLVASLHRCWTGSEIVQTPFFFVGHSTISKTFQNNLPLQKTSPNQLFVVVRFVGSFGPLFFSYGFPQFNPLFSHGFAVFASHVFFIPTFFPPKKGDSNTRHDLHSTLQALHLQLQSSRLQMAQESSRALGLGWMDGDEIFG